MATSRNVERRQLNAEEFALVDQTRQPGVQALGEREVAQLLTRLRERRDRARDLANRQRRTVQRKQRDGVSTFEAKDLGNREKAGLLGEAIARLSKERERRRQAGGLVENAGRALRMRRGALAADLANRPDPGSRAGAGLNPVENPTADRIGSAMEAGRVSQFVRDAQARRDAR